MHSKIKWHSLRSTIAFLKIENMHFQGFYGVLRWDALRSETPGGEIWCSFYFMHFSVQNNNLLMFYAFFHSMLII